MDLFVIVFIALVAVMIVISAVVFGFVFFNVARFSGRVFTHVERELDRQAAASEPAKRVECEHCRSIVSGERCPNCGAPLA